MHKTGRNKTGRQGSWKKRRNRIKESTTKLWLFSFFENWKEIKRRESQQARGNIRIFWGRCVWGSQISSYRRCPAAPPSFLTPLLNLFLLSTLPSFPFKPSSEILNIINFNFCADAPQGRQASVPPFWPLSDNPKVMTDDLAERGIHFATKCN